MDDTYFIKWKTYCDHLVGVFKDLGTEGHFSDVTLVSDDQIQTPAHKVVLSACSPVLKTLLVTNPHSHPLLYLRGIKHTELQALLKFMYFGETQIFENRINDFVCVAKDLEINSKNLEISKEQDEAEMENQSINGQKDAPDSEVQTIADELRMVRNEQIPESNKNKEFLSISKYLEVQKIICGKQQETINEDIKSDTFQEEPAVNEVPINSKGEETTAVKSTKIRKIRIARPRQKLVANSEGRFNCDECEATFTVNSSIKLHKKSMHEGERFYCDECDAVFTQNGHLKTHKKSLHEGKN